MRVFTLAVLMVLLSSTILFAQATRTKVTGVASTTTIVDKVKPAGNNGDATDYTIDFEDEIEWTFDFTPWTVIDVDLLNTYSFSGYTFPHQNEPMAYIVFNPATVVPSMAGDPEIQPHSGAQFGACMAAVPAPPQGNDDWFISSQVPVGVGATFTFWAKSYVDTYGLERFNVAVSTTGNNPADFTVISGPGYVEAPIVWTEYTYDLSAYAGENIYVAIQCVSYDAFVFMIDDLVIDPGTVTSDCDNFDSYTAGALLCPQSGGLWTTWDNNPGGPYDGYVSDLNFVSAPNSLEINLAVIESDLIYNLNQTTTGRWEISLDIGVPAGTYGGYYNVMQDMTLFGAANEWGFQVYFASDGTGYMQDAAFNQTDFTYPVGYWIHSNLIVDLDNDWAEYWLGGVLVNEWQWDIDGPNMLGVIDIYAAAPGSDDPLFYIDDVCFKELNPVGIDPVGNENTGIRLFPNPVQQYLNITSPEEMVSVQIINTVGQTVFTSTVNGKATQINTQNLESGLYIIQIQTKNGFETKKFMKK